MGSNSQPRMSVHKLPHDYSQDSIAPALVTCSMSEGHWHFGEVELLNHSEAWRCRMYLRGLAGVLQRLRHLLLGIAMGVPGLLYLHNIVHAAHILMTKAFQ